jgi:uncharacterized protein (DUF2336 family)
MNFKLPGAPMFDHLTKLAQDRTPARRAELLVSITDLFASAGHGVSEAISEIYSDIVIHVVPYISAPERTQLAIRLAELPTAPVSLMLDFARDDILLADPVLRRSLALADEHLIALAASTSHDHQMAIAGRNELSEPVSDALIEHGDARILRAVARNPRARLSVSGLSRLVAEAACNLDIRQGLAARGDGSAQAMGELIPFPSEAPKPRRRREKIADQAEIVSWPVAPVDASERPARASSPAAHPVASVIAAIASDDRMLEVAILLADYAGLPADLVSRMIAKTDSALLAILCKAAGIDDETFALIAEIRGRRFNQVPEQVAAMVEGYCVMPFDEADRALRFMRARHAERMATMAGAVPA